VDASACAVGLCRWRARSFGRRATYRGGTKARETSAKIATSNGLKVDLIGKIPPALEMKASALLRDLSDDHAAGKMTARQPPVSSPSPSRGSL
jgi:hypothetical protein